MLYLVLLAGGRSRRMGKDKTGLSLPGLSADFFQNALHILNECAQIWKKEGWDCRICVSCRAEQQKDFENRLKEGAFPVRSQAVFLPYFLIDEGRGVSEAILLCLKSLCSKSDPQEKAVQSESQEIPVQSVPQESAVQSDSQESPVQSVPQESPVLSVSQESAVQGDSQESAVQSDSQEKAVQGDSQESPDQSDSQGKAVQGSSQESPVQSVSQESAINDGIGTENPQCRDWCLFVPCDAPFLQENILRQLLPERGKIFPVTLFMEENSQKKEPLVALYSAAAIPLLEQAVGNHAPLSRAFYGHERLIPYSDSQSGTFSNFNYPQDLEKLRR